MKYQPLRPRIRNEFLMGTFVTIMAPDFVESLGGSGLDFICLEGEHSAFGIAQTESLIRAADLAGLPTVVRIAELGPDIPRVLDLGASGVIVPRIETVEEARDVVRRARYAPDGERGSGPGRATGYGTQVQSYLAEANQAILVAIQIETAKGLEDVEAITAVPGLDAVCVGPFDLAMAIGEPIGSPAHLEAVQHINAVARRNGLEAITIAPAPQIVKAARAAGDRMVIFGADRLFFMHGIQQMMAAARE